MEIVAFALSLVSFIGFIICIILLFHSSKEIAKLQRSEDEQWEEIDKLKDNIRNCVNEFVKFKSEISEQLESKEYIPDVNKLNEKL